jgi:hypothetical protein
MVDSTRQTGQTSFDLQEEVKDDMVAHLRNSIQTVENIYQAKMNEINRKLYTLRNKLSRLVTDKSDPMMSPREISKKMEKKQAQITTCVESANSLQAIREEFKSETDGLCGRTGIRIDTLDNEPKSPDSEQSECQRLTAKIASLEKEVDRLRRERAQSDARA